MNFSSKIFQTVKLHLAGYPDIEGHIFHQISKYLPAFQQPRAAAVKFSETYVATWRGEEPMWGALWPEKAGSRRKRGVYGDSEGKGGDKQEYLWLSFVWELSSFKFKFKITFKVNCSAVFNLETMLAAPGEKFLDSNRCCQWSSWILLKKKKSSCC